MPVVVVETTVDASAAVMTVASTVSHSGPIHWMNIAAIVWAVGVVVSLCLGVAGYLATLRRFQRSAVESSATVEATVQTMCESSGIKRAPKILVSSAVESPAVAGLWRPVLLLPANFEQAFSQAEIVLVLKHELMHLKRHDLPVNAVVCVLQAIHWFNPVIWFAAWRVRTDRESACDAQVLASDQTDCRNDYGQALLKVQSAYCPRGLSLGLVGMFENGRSMRERIMAIANYRRAHPLMSLMGVAWIVGLTVFGATHAEPLKPEKEPVKDTAVSDDSIVAMVNGRLIFKADLKKTIESQQSALRYRYRDNSKQLEIELKDIEHKALDSLIDRELILQEFTKLGGAIKPKYVEEDINAIIKEQFKGDREKFEAELAKSGMTLKTFHELREKMIIVQVMRSKQGSKLPAPTDVEVEDYFKAHEANWRGTDKVKIRTITIPKYTTEAGSTPEKQKQLFEEIVAKVTGGADFADTAKKYSKDSRADKGGEWDWMEMKALNPKMRETVASLAPGKVSVFVDADSAYLLIAVRGKKAGEAPSLDDTRTEIEKKIKAERTSAAAEKWLAELRSKANIRRNVQ